MARKVILLCAVAAAVSVSGCGAMNGAVSSRPVQPESSAVSGISSAAISQQRSSSAVVNLKFPEGKGSTDKERTITSLTKVTGVENLYLMTYYGDYEKIAKEQNDTMVNELRPKAPAGCTLLSMTGDKSRPIYGRNFDNPPGTGALLALYKPKNKYASVAFSRPGDLGIPSGSDIARLNNLQKEGLMKAPFYTTDGVNEKGLAVSLAYNPPGVSTEGFKGESVFITNLMRKILDNAADVNAAVKICRDEKAFDFGLDTLTHHFLIADARANSTIAEFSNGNWQFFQNDTPYQAVTNVPLYHVPEAQREANCWRYKTASDLLAKKNGRGDWKDMLDILKAVHQGPGTIWSYSADLTAGTLHLCMNGDYSKVFCVNFRQ